MTKILIIDDDKIIRENITDILQFNGFEVFTADNGKKGIETAINIQPDLIICDIIMSEASGYEVLQTIKSNQLLMFIPFVFLSAKTDPAEIRRGMNLGADDYLTKPFSVHDLLHLINSKLEKSRSFRRLLNEKKEEVLGLYQNMNIHEFNTPMNGILLGTTILKESESMTEMEKELINMIWSSANRLYRNLSNISLYHQLVDQHYSLYKEEIKITGIINKIEEIGRKYNRTNDIILSIDHRIENKKLDKKLLETIIIELLDNSLKFSGRGTLINFKIDASENHILIVIDYPNDQHFTKEQYGKHSAYVQFNKESQTKGGLGLGLALVKAICNQLKASILVDFTFSKSIKFEISIPLK